MTADGRPRPEAIVTPLVALVVGLLAMGLLRWLGKYGGGLAPFSGLATPGYILITVLVVRRLVRLKLPLNRFGFGRPPDVRQLVVFAGCTMLLVGEAQWVQPIVEHILGGARDLSRFDEATQSRKSLWALLFFSWTFAAFGEEFVFRIVLMRGLAYLMNETRRGLALAVVGQAVVFGLVHAYQGPTGVAETFLDGLVFGGATVTARWSIWPAATAHGVLNTVGILSLA